MIIQCAECRTKFRLDDEKVSDRGVKVRCAKCRHVFTVHKNAEQGEALVDQMPVPVVAPVAASLADETVRIPQEQPAEMATPVLSVEKGKKEESSFDFGDISFSTETPAAAPSDVDFGEMTMVIPPKKPAEPVADFGFDFNTTPVQTPVVDDVSFDFGEAFSSSVDDSAQKDQFDFGGRSSSAVAPATDIDLGGFDFGEASATATTASTDIDTTDFSDFNAATAPVAKSGGHDFGFDDAVPHSADSGDNFDFSSVDFGAAQPATSKAAPATATAEVDTFSLGEIDFSTETAAVKVEETGKVSAGAALFAPVEEPVVRQQAPAVPDITFEAPPEPVEAPPLSITSRRRQSSTISIVIGVIVVVVLGVLGYMAYTFINDGSKAVSMLNKAGVPADEGKITVQNVKAYYISKSAAGELLVISGDAMNGYKKARAALQLKGMVFGASNQVLATKTAYAGNQLKQEQLVSMTVEKIEAAMNNQFGDSLANLEVQPGKTIPFTIVIINPPKEGKDFGVEPVGSTVAASK